MLTVAWLCFSLHVKRVVCIGITSLLQLPVASLPFANLIRDLVIALVSFIEGWEAQRQGSLNFVRGMYGGQT